MTAPVRTAREMRDAAVFDLRAAGQDHAANIVAAIPVAEGPTVEEAVIVYAAATGDATPHLHTHRMALRAVLALCGGETRERWASWEEALDAFCAQDTNEGGIRAVLAKAPPEGP